MPRSIVGFYLDRDGSAPVLAWLTQLRSRDRRGYAKCVVRIQRLAEEGHALRRPEADYPRDGIHELRARQGHVNYRILYFFHGQNAVIRACGLTKEGEIPDAEIERALRRKAAFESDPATHLLEVSDDEEDI